MMAVIVGIFDILTKYFSFSRMGVSEEPFVEVHLLEGLSVFFIEPPRDLFD